MVSPFFFAYHTLLDKENKQLYFYPLNNNYKMKDIIKEDDDKDYLNTFSIICIVLAIIIRGFAFN